MVFRVIRTLANGAAAVVQWKLKTGRTHQIRVHAQHMGCPLFGDSSYGGVHHAISKIGRGDKQRCGFRIIVPVVCEVTHDMTRSKTKTTCVGKKLSKGL